MARRSKRSVAIPADARKKAVCADQAPVAKSTPLDARDIGVGAVVTAVAAILYGMSAARDIVVGDTPELVTAAISWELRIRRGIHSSRCSVISSVCYRPVRCRSG